MHVALKLLEEILSSFLGGANNDLMRAAELSARTDIPKNSTGMESGNDSVDPILTHLTLAWMI